eukprot:15435900-Alexandrium_andersonii.AAC.1
MHDFSLRPHFAIDDLRKFNGVIPGAWRLDATRNLTKCSRPWADMGTQLKSLEDAIDTLLVIENVWELFLAAYLSKLWE